MKKTLTKGKYAQVVGTFDLHDSSGTIDYVTPVDFATKTSEGEVANLRLIGEGPSGVVFDTPVHPQRNSCAPHADSGTFEEFVPVSPALRTVKLMVGTTVAAQYKRGLDSAGLPVTVAGLNLSSPYKLQISSAALPTPGVTYSVQAKPDSSASWMTLAVGLDAPNSEVNINQFPGANKIEVRVLRTDGFTETEVLRETKQF